MRWSTDNIFELISESEIAELFDRCSSTKIVWFGVTTESKEPAPIIAEKDDIKPPIMSKNDDDQPVHAPFFAWRSKPMQGSTIMMSLLDAMERALIRGRRMMMPSHKIMWRQR
jgi:hypothetical protein